MPEVALVVWPLLGASRRCLLRTIPVLPGYRVAIVRLTVMIPALALLLSRDALTADEVLVDYEARGHHREIPP